MTSWNFLTSHGQALLCITDEPDVRLRDLAASLGITERRAYGIVSDLIGAGYLVKTKDGRRNHYEIMSDLPMPEGPCRDRAIGEVLDVLVGPHTERRAERRLR